MCKCSVSNCKNSAEYLVLLVDYYESDTRFFVEVDRTCPLLCNKHKIENENTAQGEERARASIIYRYSNQHNAQGVTKYIPLDRIKNLLKEK